MQPLTSTFSLEQTIFSFCKLGIGIAIVYAGIGKTLRLAGRIWQWRRFHTTLESNFAKSKSSVQKVAV